ncbi:putative uncharacterized protein [Clostridium sp. CAG:632]|jgi:flagellar motility protein MotE (MotC chaperone)|nr:hypothetical protein [Clostridium sp.]CCY58912.1 putative uncharacterized protein [Clostridium sp. CAG:632]
MAKGKNDEEKAGGKLLSAVLIFMIIIVWLAAMVILIKLDVGHFGSRILRPVLKDVPVINMILPAASDDEAANETSLPYKNLAEALAQIDALNATVAADQEKIQSMTEQIQEKDNEIVRLKGFEDDQERFVQLKNEFYNEVVYGNSAPDADTYIKWYESIDPDAAEEIYRQVVAQQQASSEIKDLATTYAEMEPASAAKILETMKGDLDTVTKIMQEMASSDRAEIMAEMDPDFAANITKKLMP